MQLEALRKIVVDALEELKAQDIKVLDVRGIASFTDLMVVASGTSTRQVKALADKVIEKCALVGIRPLGVEGQREAEWVLVDLNDIVVHVMLPQTRDFYNLEKLWLVSDRASYQPHGGRLKCLVGPMKIHLLAVGARMPGWVKTGYAEYAGRLPRECTLNLVEIPAGNRGPNTEVARAIRAEGERLLAAIPAGSRVVALDERGLEWSTAQLAGQLTNWLRDGRDLSLLVGGSRRPGSRLPRPRRPAMVAVAADPAAFAGAGGGRRTALPGMESVAQPSLPPCLTCWLSISISLPRRHVVANCCARSAFPTTCCRSWWTKPRCPMNRHPTMSPDWRWPRRGPARER